MTTDDLGFSIAEDLSISLSRANVLVGVASLPVVLAMLLLFQIVSPALSGHAGSLSLAAIGLTLVATLPGIFLHEVIHGATWRAFGRLGRGRVTFGFHRATLTPYAHALDPMPVWAYRAGAVLPAILLGVLPYAAGILWGSLPVALFGILFVTAAGGDMLVLWLLRKAKGGAQVLDHPSRAGCLIVERVASRQSGGSWAGGGEAGAP